MKKQVLLPLIALILLPITLMVASTTGDLGDDVPESQLLTNDEMAAYQLYLDHRPIPSDKNCIMQSKLIPNGQHAYLTFNNQRAFEASSAELILITQTTSLKGKCDPVNQTIELYAPPHHIREVLLENRFVARRRNAKKLRCLIL